MNVIETVIVFILLSMGPSAFCQGGSSFEPETTLAAATTSTKKTAPATATSARFHKRFPQLFTGFAIEIATSTYPMDRTRPIFKQFGNVFFDKLSEGGYSYLIMANFSTKVAALEFVTNVVKPKAEEARLVQYIEGNRKVIRE